MLSKTGIPEPSPAREGEEEVHACRGQGRQGQEQELGNEFCRVLGKSEPLVVFMFSKGKMFGSRVQGCWCGLN